MRPSPISTIPEALEYLGKATNRKWTQSIFFDAILENKLILNAVTPPGKFPTLRKLDYGEAHAKEIPQFERRFAELHNAHIKELMSQGDTFTQYCKNCDMVDETVNDEEIINNAAELSKALDPYPDPFEFYFFNEPMHITVEGVRVPALVLQRLVNAPSVEPVLLGDGALGSRQQDDSDGLTKREKQIRFILSTAIKLNYEVLMIPTGGKGKLMIECKKMASELFGAGDDPFLDAWKEARAQNRIQMVDHQKFVSK
ncbi:hypothetical protein [Collimonas fungivorans]|uniref:hypothetical protein n=1 Tax=Collimonas fungivorans TaxID=158899 RepID=UPI003FA34A8E